MGVGVLFFFYLVSKLFGSGSSSGGLNLVGTSGGGGPNVVIVTVLDEQALSDKYIQRIKQNREDYAKRHGKFSFFSLLPKQLLFSFSFLCELLQLWAL